MTISLLHQKPAFAGGKSIKSKGIPLTKNMGEVRAVRCALLATGALLAGYSFGRFPDIIPPVGEAGQETPSVVVSVTADPKKIVSDNFRFVFIAGLEGAGHHYLMSAENHMFDSNPDISRIAEGYEISPWPYYVPVAMGGNASSFAEAENQAAEQMQNMAKEVARLPFPGTVCVTHNAWSYPTFTGAGKVMNYIDVQRMAAAAEAGGVDMRVVYLRRTAKDIVVANTVHRDFHT